MLVVLWEKSPNKVRRTEATAMDVDCGPFMLSFQSPVFLFKSVKSQTSLVHFCGQNYIDFHRKRKNLSSVANNAASEKKIGAQAVTTSIRAH